MNEDEKAFLRECLKKLPAKFWENEDYDVGGYISKKDLFELLQDSPQR